MSYKSRIWNYLTSHGMTKAGAAGMMGNMWVESGFIPNNLQGSANKRLGLSDAEYTRRVDNGKYTNFVNDSAGYGLCQWTVSDRKRRLYRYAKASGTSIGNLEMQCAYLIVEMKQHYSNVWSIVSTTNNYVTASDAVLIHFESPASLRTNKRQQTINNRRAKSKSIYYEFYKTTQKQTKDSKGSSKKKSSTTEDKTSVSEKESTKNKTSTKASQKSSVDSGDIAGMIKLGGLRRRSCIYADGKLLWQPGLEDDDYKIIDPKLEIAINAAGSLEFTLPYNHAMYNSLKKLTTTITVKTTDDDINYKLVWRGRVLETTTSFNKSKQVLCEGELAFLNDSIIRPYLYTRKPSVMFDYYINKHNAEVSDNRKFKSYYTDVTYDEKDSLMIEFENTEYESAYDNMTNQLLDVVGGYIKALNGKITYSKQPGGTGKQVIRFGSSILDLEEYINAADIFTVLIPLGALVPTTITQDGVETQVDKRRTIKTVNSGKDFLESQTGIGLFGRIVKTYTWDDISDANTLKSLGKDLLKQSIKQAITITVKAIDLHLLDVDVEELYLGYSYRIISEPHGIDTYFVLVKAEYDLGNPANSTFTFGNAFSALTDKVIKTNKKAKLNSANIDTIKSANMEA